MTIVGRSPFSRSRERSLPSGLTRGGAERRMKGAPRRAASERLWNNEARASSTGIAGAVNRKRFPFSKVRAPIFVGGPLGTAADITFQQGRLNAEGSAFRCKRIFTRLRDG